MFALFRFVAECDLIEVFSLAFRPHSIREVAVAPADHTALVRRQCRCAVRLHVDYSCMATSVCFCVCVFVCGLARMTQNGVRCALPPIVEPNTMNVPARANVHICY